MSRFKPYTREESEQHAYYSIPKELFTNSDYKQISTDAKVLYGLLRDRNQLSIKNNWVDDNGHIYIIFTREEVMEVLDVAKPKAVNLFKELENVELIKDVRQGLNKPNIIYVGKITPESQSNQRKLENLTSGSNKNEIQEVTKSYSSNTDINNTNKNKNQSVSPEEKQIDGQTDDLQELKSIFEKSNVDLYGTKLFIQETIKKMWFSGNIPYQLKMDLTHDDIKDRLKHLKSSHIDNALLKMQGVKTNKEVYFMKCLLTSIVESDLDLYIAESKEN